MKNGVSKRVLGLVFLTIGNCLMGFGPKTFFNIRPQNTNLMRELIGVLPEIVNVDEMYTGNPYSVMIEYFRSFEADKIAKSLFGGSHLLFSGSGVVGRDKSAILADYFGLPRDFNSSVCFSPTVTNLLVDLGGHQRLDRFLSGLYIRFHLPIVHSKWDLNMSERVVAAGSGFNKGEVDGAGLPVAEAAYPAGYLGPDRLALADLFNRVEEVFQGRNVFGDMSEPLRFGKIFGRQVLTRVADAQLALGWHFLATDWYHIGGALRLGLPLGNKSEAEFLFEPMVGGNGHVEIGLGLTGHVDVWQSTNENHWFGLYIDANITHLCSATQKRSFDFTRNGNGSRYMLLVDNGSPSDNLFFDGPGVRPASSQYQRRLIPAINKTTLSTKVSVGVQADVVVMGSYQGECGGIDFGYNLWARSKEKGRRCHKLESGRFGFKGDAQVYGFDNNNLAIPLTVSQQQATITGGQGTGNFATRATSFDNSNADNSAQLFSSTVALAPLNAADTPFLTAATTVNGSDPFNFLTDNDINNASGLVDSAVTHKLFAHVHYVGHGDDRYTPFIGIGGMIERMQGCHQKNGGFNQWGLWVKGGVSY